jgi:hypothetical protein
MVGIMRAADASQAAYFRGVLADEGEQIARQLADTLVRLRACVNGEQVVGLRVLARLRSEVRGLEIKKRDIERMIAALDRRYSALWAREV